MIYRLLLAGLLASAFSINAYAATRYISDDLVVYMHSGPNNKYRITGTAKAGEAVNILASDAETKYVQIRLSRNNKEGWIEGRYINNEPGLKAQLNQTKSQLETTQQALESLQTSTQDSASQASGQIESQRAKIETLESKNGILNNQLIELQKQNDQLTAELDTLDEDIQMQWLMRGGAIAGAGLILGLIIPYLPRRKKPQEQRWM